MEDIRHRDRIGMAVADDFHEVIDIAHSPRSNHRDRHHIGHRPHHNWCRFSWNRCRIHVRWHRPYIYGGRVIVGGPSYVAPTYAAKGPCTCLTKTYTADNLVVFKDVCTKEVASAER